MPSDGYKEVSETIGVCHHGHAGDSRTTDTPGTVLPTMTK
jgi:hypothetical protein